MLVWLWELLSTQSVANTVLVISLVAAAILGSMEGDGFRRFLHSYLTAFMAALAIGLGTLWWVTLQNQTGASYRNASSDDRVDARRRCGHQ